MFRWSFLPLVFCFVYHSGILPVGNTSTFIPVTGKKGDNATLTCAFKGNKISEIELQNKQKENIVVCETEECRGRVIKKGACDVIIRNLSFSDAGTYFLTVYYDADHNVQDKKTSEYHLHIQDEISVKKGEDLKLHVLWISADKVERNSNGEWKEVWRRYHGVNNSDRLNASDETLTIKAFIANDAGTYRVLDSKGETWITITVSVTVSSPESGSKGGLGDTEQPTVETPSIVGVCFGVGALVALGVVSLIVLFKFDVRTCQRRQRPRTAHEEAELQEMNLNGDQAQDS